ncbi:MAG: hydroxymethylbilane synthase [Armatimonadetes bacterium]|nr:hydroxymethylbilane synthase [Armatimonadota bacterium]
MPDRLVLATRGSKLALAQSQLVAEQLSQHAPHLQIELLVVKTTGDKISDGSLSEAGGVGLFAKEVEEALLDGRADFAVHSLKDLPTEMPSGLTLAAMPERADPRDVLVCRDADGIDALPEGAVIGTSSPRRMAQLAHYRPDLRFHPLRGNIDTRLRRLESEGLDAIVLAGAGLLRLGMADRITQWLPLEISLPAAGQGILAVEARADDTRTISALSAIDCRTARVCALVERAALAALGGGCRQPVGVLARVDAGMCQVRGVILEPDGRDCCRACVTGGLDAPEDLGRELARELRQMGATRMLEQNKGSWSTEHPRGKQ